MKPQELMVLCRCSEGETDITQIIQSSFAVFLKKELQNVEKCLRSCDMLYNNYNEWPLISGGITCT